MTANPNAMAAAISAMIMGNRISGKPRPPEAGRGRLAWVTHGRATSSVLHRGLLRASPRRYVRARRGVRVHGRRGDGHEGSRQPGRHGDAEAGGRERTGDRSDPRALVVAH